ncbi:hypothetical protein SCAB_22441 [Streptomyces scabiei 87.22]|uniref:Uncharacterized protein n=3 Tax=Streptomyces TaxID=1883 RepID=A0ABW9IQR9_STRGJ|nr:MULTISPECIES: hypothetical protein [Streptomyces]MBP5860581.1 hypothetical protein [Streptomyces sp. LBUM 1484]MBP5878925.1 hypothetical protein [Streptomyces sp. LBUM 1477]MBP5886858.1 hypothetical protein [Streptomyces sp. LBUM 1487]MBP5902855.1 hypothetical protein [Streptomyces sp. LBUM 1488]MDX2531827.1 hypothetical protein [Streptomyces scabiei]
MPALTPDTIRTATETLSHLTDYLREGPNPVEALALVEPLLDEYTGLPVQLADTLRALARAVQEHPGTPRTAQLDLLITELRTAAWEQTDQHTLHYVLDDLRDLYGSTAVNGQGYGRCR